MFDELTSKCPTWSDGTILLKDAAGEIVGYGWIDRESGKLEVRAPEGGGVRCLADCSAIPRGN